MVFWSPIGAETIVSPVGIEAYASGHGPVFYYGVTVFHS